MTISYDKAFKTAAEKLGEYLGLLYGISVEYATFGGDISFAKTNCASEHFSLVVTDEKVVISAGDTKGALYGASTLLQLADRETKLFRARFQAYIFIEFFYIICYN